MSDQSEQKSAGCLGTLLIWLIILTIPACIIAYFTYDPDRISYVDAEKVMMRSKSTVYNYLNRDGAVIKEFPEYWNSWSFDSRHMRTSKNTRGHVIISYRLVYYVDFILAGMELETDVIVDVDHNKNTDSWTIKKVHMREFNKYVGQLLQRRR